MVEGWGGSLGELKGRDLGRVFEGSARNEQICRRKPDVA